MGKFVKSRTKGDFRRVIGKEIEVFLKSAFNQKTLYEGQLKTAEEESITIETKNGVISIPLDIINKGKLKIDFRR